MPSSSTDVANYALALLGSGRITDIADTTSKNARILSLHYDQARRELLRSHRWNWAIARSTLTAHADEPEYGWSYQYPLPADFLRLDTVNELSVWDSHRADWFELEHGRDANGDAIGKVILSNAENLRIRYVADIESVNQFDPLFTQALTVLLAAKAARAITGSDVIEKQFREQFWQLDYPRAAQADGAETRGGENPPLIDAMNRSYTVRSRGIRGVELPLPLAPSSTTGFPSPANDEVDVEGEF